VDWDEPIIRRWLEPLATRRGEIGELFAEDLAELSLAWRDGAIRETSVRRESGTAARRRSDGREHLAFVSGSDEAAAREAIRAVRAEAGLSPLPIRAARSAETEDGAELFPDGDRWARRLTSLLARHAPRHELVFRLRDSARRVLADGGRRGASARRLLSIEGRVTAMSRAGDETRAFAFHAPASDASADELRAALAAAVTPRDRPVPPPSGETDVVLAGGCAAVFFHEVLGHPLEADAGVSPLRSLPDARVAVAALDVTDDPRRLDLFGGYESDDEGTAPRPARLVASGLLGAPLADRSHAEGGSGSGHGRRASAADAPRPRGSNVVVAAGSADPDEMLRRLHDGLWIEELDGGSVEIASGRFRLRFPRARRVRRGRLADEISRGVIAGDLLPALGAVEPAFGRESRPCRSFGWCARDGQVLPVGGAAPDVLVRRLHVRPDA